MRAILTMTLNDLQIFFSQPGNWVGLVLLPILFTVGLGFAFGGDSGPVTLRVDVVDLDNSAQSAQLLDELRVANSTLVLCPMDQDEGDRCDVATLPTTEPLTVASGQERVREGESAALLVIPAGYGDALATLREAQIDFYSLTVPTSPDPVRETLDAVLQRVNSAALTAGVVDALLVNVGEQTGATAAIEPWRGAFVDDLYANVETMMAQRPSSVRFESVGGESRNAGVEGFTQSVPGVGSMYVMFTVLGGMTLIQRERQRWTLQRLGVFPLTRGQILGGKILTYFTLGMLQYLVVFAVGLLVGLDFGANPWLLLPPMASFVLCCTALTFAIAPSLHSEGQASVVTQLLALTFASLGGAWWPLEIVPQFMQLVGHLTPVAWVMDAFRDLLFYGGGVSEILPELGVLLGASVLLFGVGIRRFRYI